MKKILMLSGKGGTGKTTLAGAFIHLSEAIAYGDCDVDAPNLHLIMKETAKGEKETYYGLPKAVISQDACISCTWASLTSFTTFAGVPMIRDRGGNCLPGVTTDPAPTIDSRPITAPSRMIEPMPIRQRSLTVQPWRITRWPTVTSLPMMVG